MAHSHHETETITYRVMMLATKIKMDESELLGAYNAGCRCVLVLSDDSDVVKCMKWSNVRRRYSQRE